MNIRNYSQHTVLLLLIIAPLFVMASEDEEALLSIYGDEDFISIATGAQQPISQAPAVATVITAEDIKNIGATDIDEILETVPGLHVSRSHIANNPIYTFRGIFSNTNPQVLLLINSIPITNLYQGDRNQAWGGMPVQSISRIEVIRGPGSAIYGADAFAGVINIITKTAMEIDGLEFGVRAGSFDSQDAWVLAGKSWNGFNLAFMLEYGHTDGYNETIGVDAQTGLDSIFGTNASLAPGSIHTGGDNIDARLDISKGDWQLRAGLQRRFDLESGAGINQALDSNSRFESNRWNADLTYHNPGVAEHWDVTAQISFLDTSQEVEEDLLLFPPGAVIPGLGGPFQNGVIGNPEVFERHWRFNFSTFYSGFDRHTIRFGAGYENSDIRKVRESRNFGLDGNGNPIPINGPPVSVTDTPVVFLPEDDRDNYHFFIQDAWRFANDWEFTAGGRYDDYSDFGDTFNPRLALVWSARHNLTVKVLYGQAFRAPSFAELRNQNVPSALGNDDLDPEEIETFELAFDYHPTNKLNLNLNVYYYKWDDIIQFVPDANGITLTADNTGEQTGAGLEFEANWAVTRNLDLIGNYAYQNAEDEDTNTDAGNAPHHQIYLRGEWEFLPGWDIVPQLNYVIDRDRVAGDTRSEVDDYAIVDLTLRKTSRRDRWDAALLVKNLLNTNAREPSLSGNPVAPIRDDLPLADRAFFGEFRFRF